MYDNHTIKPCDACHARVIFIAHSWNKSVPMLVYVRTHSRAQQQSALNSPAKAASRRRRLELVMTNCRLFPDARIRQFSDRSHFRPLELATVNIQNKYQSASVRPAELGDSDAILRVMEAATREHQPLMPPEVYDLYFRSLRDLVTGHLYRRHRQ
jgi:hypothetical protein